MRYYLSLFCLLLLASCSDSSQEKSPEQPMAKMEAAGEGKAIFQQLCASCHMLDNDATGPKLRGALERWNNDPVKLKTFIKNATAMIASGDELALQAQQRGRGNTMPAFPNLTDEQLNGLLDYIQNGR